MTRLSCNEIETGTEFLLLLSGFGGSEAVLELVKSILIERVLSERISLEGSLTRA